MAFGPHRNREPEARRAAGRLRARVVLMLASSAVCVLMGCTNGKSDEEAASSLARALCNRVAACSSALMEISWGNRDACVSGLTEATLFEIGAPGSSTTAESVEQCAADLGALSCERFIAADLPASCAPGTGARADGEPCAHSAQCTSHFCGRRDGDGCGACSPEPKPGEPCVRGACPRALRCTAGGTCERPRALGEPCDLRFFCREDLSCFEGVCQPAGAPGAVCDGQELSAPSCNLVVTGALCQPDTRRCEPVVLADAGAPCGVTEAGFALCRGGFSCVYVDELAPTGACAPRAAAGDACATNAVRFSACQEPLRCNSGTCEPPDGQHCDPIDTPGG